MGARAVITDEELALIAEKSKKDPEVVDLYRSNDYMTAYALHTDWRVRHDGPRSAIGDPKDWDRHGELQAEFLKRMGLRQHHTLLEIGCGTGRLARKMVPYLDPKGYWGVDISQSATQAADEMLRAEGCQYFRVGQSWPIGRFDYLWAFSVTIHLPQDELLVMMRSAAARMVIGSKFLFSYHPQQLEQRTGLKQFRHTLDTYQGTAYAAGLSFCKVDEWKGEQSIALAELIP